MSTDYTKYVDTTIGNVGHLLTATRPFVQSPHGAAFVEPFFNPGVMDIYTADKIYGFKIGSAIIMPTIGGKKSFADSASCYDHDLEIAKPHYYETLLEDYEITERHTSLENVAMFEFDFPQDCDCYLNVYFKNCIGTKKAENKIYGNANNSRSNLSTLISFQDAEITEEYFERTPNSYRPDDLEDTKVYRIKFASNCGKIAVVVSAIGYAACDDAFISKLYGKSFDNIKETCKDRWNELLSKIDVKGNEREKRIFYTSIYRSCCRMHNYSDNNEYIGYDNEIHKNSGHDFYCDDGIWDTYRTSHPLQLIIEPKVHEDIIESYLRMFKQSGWLPHFPYLGANVPCMLGRHSTALLADSYVKGVPMNVEAAFEAAYKDGTSRTMLPWRDGMADELTECYYKNGFFPALDEEEEETFPDTHEFENRQAVAVTMENAYDDYCLAVLSKAVGKTQEYEEFMRRSKNYENVYDKSIGFVRGKKADGSFVSPYNPKLCGGQGGRKYFAENNAYIYNFNVQHDPEGLAELMGGKEEMAKRLDELFIEQYEVPKYKFLSQYPDATGLIGQYCQGNEPSFHIPYMYNYVGQAWKTQKRLRQIMNLWFTDTPTGICGDEDGGAMCGWYVFSAMGFYPFCPGKPWYDLGSPLFDKITITLPNNKTFTIIAEGASEKAKYIKKAELNGTALEKAGFTHKQLMEGGVLVLTMDKRPNKELFN